MPIEGLSTKRRMPRIGKFHLGYKDPQRGFPVRTDYFVLPKDHPQFEELKKTLGEKPKELPILIPVEDEEKWCSQYYRAYSKSRGLVCKGNGIEAVRMVAKGTDNIAWADCKEIEMKTVQCVGRECPFYQQKKCGEIMNMQFLLPDIKGLGVWQVDTGSINSIININSASELIKGIYKRIAMIPLKLTLEPKECNNPETGKKQTVYVMNLRVNMKLSELAAAARQQGEILELPMPDDETPDYAQEFEPAPPDTHTVQENIEQLWPEDDKKEPPTSKPPAAPPAKPEKAKEPKEVKPVKTLGDLFTACTKNHSEHFATRQDVLDYLKKSEADIVDPAAEYAEIEKKLAA